eukprot:gnl/TRDRNA2_/TRDRNA2_167013_c0_seq5.p1 gnl/TRDRNA2_/TRDRNA2_167013_c0~~gnl/TRDRNA2_/TRDRNA2_167013_c0_seq5.p1  ORF type:complete len:227 (+),score=46.69 gnl/TRDRNA2_/TRDRNA2_167013_c0_seq5:65-682(+)
MRAVRAILLLAYTARADVIELLASRRAAKQDKMVNRMLRILQHHWVDLDSTMLGKKEAKPKEAKPRARKKATNATEAAGEDDDGEKMVDPKAIRRDLKKRRRKLMRWAFKKQKKDEPLDVDHEVVLKSFEDPDLIGKAGITTAWDEETGLYTVSLQGGLEVAVKPEQLEHPDYDEEKEDGVSESLSEEKEGLSALSAMKPTRNSH